MGELFHAPVVLSPGIRGAARRAAAWRARRAAVSNGLPIWRYRTARRCIQRAFLANARDAGGRAGRPRRRLA
jgi:hypothetical protein